MTSDGEKKCERDPIFEDLMLFLLYWSKAKRPGYRKSYTSAELYKECAECIVEATEPMRSIISAIRIPDIAEYAAILYRLHVISAITTTRVCKIMMTPIGFDAYHHSLTTGANGFAHDRMREYVKLLALASQSSPSQNSELTSSSASHDGETRTDLPRVC